MTDQTCIPSPDQVRALLSEPFAAAGYEIEDVTADTRSRPQRLRIVVDGDATPDLETIAELSRTASTLLDGPAGPDGPAGYLLEVSSPGIERPLTAERHFRRARGRRVEFSLIDGSALTGRLGAVSDGAADVVVRDGSGWVVRRIALVDIRAAVVQVEFSAPHARELELAALADPRTADPRTAHPRTADPRTADPRTAEPRTKGANTT